MSRSRTVKVVPIEFKLKLSFSNSDYKNTPQTLFNFLLYLESMAEKMEEEKVWDEMKYEIFKKPLLENVLEESIKRKL